MTDHDPGRRPPRDAPPVLAYDPRADARPARKWPPYGWTGLVMATFGSALIALSVYRPGGEPTFCLFGPIGVVALVQGAWLSSAGLVEPGRSRWPAVGGLTVVLGGAAVIVKVVWPVARGLFGM